MRSHHEGRLYFVCEVQIHLTCDTTAHKKVLHKQQWVAGEEWLKRKSQPGEKNTGVQQAAKLKCTLYEPIHFFYWQLGQLVTARGFLLVSGESPDVCRHRVVSPNALALRNCTDHILSWDNSFVCFQFFLFFLQWHIVENRHDSLQAHSCFFFVVMDISEMCRYCFLLPLQQKGN